MSFNYPACFSLNKNKHLIPPQPFCHSVHKPRPVPMKRRPVYRQHLRHVVRAHVKPIPPLHPRYKLRRRFPANCQAVLHPDNPLAIFQSCLPDSYHSGHPIHSSVLIFTTFLYRRFLPRLVRLRRGSITATGGKSVTSPLRRGEVRIHQHQNSSDEHSSSSSTVTRPPPPHKESHHRKMISSVTTMANTSPIARSIKVT